VKEGNEESPAAALRPVSSDLLHPPRRRTTRPGDDTTKRLAKVPGASGVESLGADGARLKVNVEATQQ
jgi:hypothetical protein